MRTETLKTCVMVGAAVVIGMAAYLGGVVSPIGWAAAGLLACAPALVMRRLWQPPVPSMSESIQKELR